MSSDFVHLRVRTEYAIEDSIVRIAPLIDAVVEQGMNAVGISDFCNFFAAVKVYQTALKRGIKPIIGVDLPCCFKDTPNEVTILPVLCQNLTGYRHATQLISKAYLEGQSAGSPRVFYEWLPEYSEGLIALSGAQLGLVDAALLKDDFDKAVEYATMLSTWFPNRFYLEIQRIGLPHEAAHHGTLVRLANERHLPLVATNGVRFLKSTEYDAHEARVCIHDGCTLADGRLAKRYTHQQYLRKPEEMVALFDDLPEAIENAVQLAKRCTVKLQIGQSFLPAFPVPADYSNETHYLEELAKTGLVERLQQTRHADEAVYVERLDLELRVIGEMGFAGYFLIVADFIGWSKSQGIRVGPGRGSGAGSLVAYVLKITDLDPLAYDLLFERFLNPERVSMPDFDVDFCMDGRDRVIEYVADKYGRHSVSQIITFGSMAAKAVVRDVGRVLSQAWTPALGLKIAQTVSHMQAGQDL